MPSPVSGGSVGAAEASLSRARRAAIKAVGPYSRARHLDRILAQRQVVPAFQPIVDLATHEVVAFEALARGPAGTPMERPDVLFGTARELNLIRELDWVCRAVSMEHAMAAGFAGGLTLFINVEPDVAATRAPDDVFFTLKNAQRDLRVVLEVTERALLDRPAELMNWLSYARERWWGVALDDVGATPASVALLPFVRPDVVKLNYHLLRDPHDEEDRRVLRAVHDYVNRTGAVLVAEGVESKAHAQRASEELGATLGQGWYFGRPTTLPRRLPSPQQVVPLLPPVQDVEEESPWAILSAAAGNHVLPATAARRRFGQIEQAAMFTRESPVVLASFPAGRGPWGTPRERLAQLRERACFVGAIGPDLTAFGEPGWRTSPVPDRDELATEWVLLAIGPHFAAAAAAYDTHQTDARGLPMLDVCWTQDREAVAAAAHVLMRKLAAPLIDFEGRLHR